MRDFQLAICARVIAKADREHPADAVLRAELKAAKGISRTDGGMISRAVFAYYRWYGWLNPKAPIAEQINEAVDRDHSFSKHLDGISPPEFEQAIPKWAKQHIKVSTEWLRQLQTQPRLWLRAHPGQGKGLAERLGECWLAGDGLLSDALRYQGAEDLFRTPEFHAGEFELLDINSQAVGWVCNPQPGETWWDACAGEGGKLLHLGDLMRNKGLIWASDRAEWRLQKLKRRTARAKMFNYRAVLWDGGAKLPTKTKFDGILVDAPCSGVGTWQRNPQARWTTTAQDVAELSAVQTNLLANVVVALKPGGRLIYSVCTLTEAETYGVADAISRRFPKLQPRPFSNPFRPGEPAAESLLLWPQDTGGNGMFIRAWRKGTV